MLLVLAATLVAAAVLPAGAHAFNISGVSIVPTSTQAASHPDVKIALSRQGSESEDLRDVNVELPAGMFQNPENAKPKCTDAQFSSDTCPNSSLMGITSTDVKAGGLLNITAPGNIYMLNPRSTDAATLGMVMRPPRICILLIFCAQPSKIFMKTAVIVNTFDDQDGIKTYTTNAPKTSTVGIPLIVTSLALTLDITINKLTLTFHGRYGAYKNLGYSMVAGTRCDKPNILKAEIISYQNVSSKTTAQYTPTGCASVPFNPSINFVPTSTVANQPTPVEFTLNIPQADATIQNSHPKIVDVDFPVGSGIDLSQLSGVNGCSESQLRVDQCPADSIIGTATSVAPYLPPTLTGTVYAMNPIGTLVPMGVVLRGARGTLVIFRGNLGVRDQGTGTGHTYARFDLIPQLPFANVKVKLTKNLYKNPNLATCGTQTTTGNITGFSGALRTVTSTYTLTGCNPAPETAITSGPPSPTSDISPTFTFTSTQPGSTFVCKVDAGTNVPCNDSNAAGGPGTTGAYTTQPLANGSHTFSVYAVNGVTPDATPATATFTVQTDFTITPTVTSSTTVAAGHPNLSTQFDITGGQPLNLQIKMPAGFSASLNSRPRCLSADAAAGNCAVASEIGNAQITVNTASGPVSGVGKAYLTDGPTAADAGGVAVEIPLSIGTFIAQAGAYLVENGRHQYIDIRNIPTQVGGTPIQVTQLRVDWAGATNRLLTNASSCAAGAFTATGTRTDGTGANPITVAYTSTGCSTTVPPFNPTMTQSFNNLAASTDTVDNFTNAIADITLPIDHASIKRLEVREPAALAPNFGSFGAASDQCTAGSIVDTDPSAAINYAFNYSTANCPVQAKVGTMTINTPLLPTPLVGDVYFVNRSPIPWFGVSFNQPGIKIGLVGVTAVPTNSAGLQQITVTFDNVPDTPITSVQFALNGPDRTSPTVGTLSGKVLAIARFDDPACTPTSTADSTITAHSGTVVTRSQVISFTGCGTP